MRYSFRPIAMVDLSRLPYDIKERITAKLDFYFSNDDPLYFATRLTDSQPKEYRFRIGDYRVIFEMRNGIAEILKIGNRKDIYR